MIKDEVFNKYFTDISPKICFNKIGVGETVIFLHGIGGNKSNWHRQMLHLSNICSTISWDARGYGDSEDYTSDLTLDDFSTDLNHLLKFCEIEKAHFVGLSMGARIAMTYYLNNPSKVLSLTLCNCFYSFGKSMSKQKQDEYINLREKPLKEGKTFSDIAPAIIRSLVKPDCKQSVIDELTKSISMLRKTPYLKCIKTAFNFDLSEYLVDFNVPTQLIFSTHDKLTPLTIGETMHKKIPNSKLNIIQDAGHLSNLEQPDQFNKILFEFINANLKN